jgi:hypothetical protein
LSAPVVSRSFERYASGGRAASQCGLWSPPATESSNSGSEMIDFSFSGMPLTAAIALRTASRPIQLRPEIVASWNASGVPCICFQLQAIWLDSSVATGGTVRPADLRTLMTAALDCPSPIRMPSIFG